ncbi:MAG: hypothetical protein AB7S77_01480 [Desulfatirhabdiaceae bacterium]
MVNFYQGDLSRQNHGEPHNLANGVNQFDVFGLMVGRGYREGDIKTTGGITGLEKEITSP